MNAEQANRFVAAKISEALNHCKSNAVDEQTLRTGLLTITIANFVNRIGKHNTIRLFSAIPDQIAAGVFDRYVDPETSGPSGNLPHHLTGAGPLPSHFIPPQISTAHQSADPNARNSEITSGDLQLPDVKRPQKRRLSF